MFFFDHQCSNRLLQHSHSHEQVKSIEPVDHDFRRGRIGHTLPPVFHWIPGRERLFQDRGRGPDPGRRVSRNLGASEAQCALLCRRFDNPFCTAFWFDEFSGSQHHGGNCSLTDRGTIWTYSLEDVIPTNMVYNFVAMKTNDGKTIEN